MASVPHVLPFSCSTPTTPAHDGIKRLAAQNYSRYFTILDPVSVTDLNEDERNNIQGILLTGGYTQDQVKLDKKTMDLLPNLRVISTPSTGSNHIDVEAATARGIRVGHSSGYLLGETVADLAFSLLLGSARHIVQGDKLAKNPDTPWSQDWKHKVMCGVDVTGATIGIIGLGHIGTAVAERARAFRMTILYHSRTQKEEQEKKLGLQFCPNLQDLLSESDFVVICIPLTAETKHFISSKQLNQMKPSATLINIARGAIVNHDDLTAALQNGVIRAAALDVTEPIHLPGDHPLLQMSNVIILPHVGVYTIGTIKNLLVASLDNLKAGIQGCELPHPVNKL